MARDRGVAMTETEVAELLDAQRTVTLATIGPDGRPHLASMWFARDGADLLMWTYAASQKARDVGRDPRVTVLAEAGEDYAELRGVSLDCVAEQVADPAAVLEFGIALQLRNSGAGRDGSTRASDGGCDAGRDDAGLGRAGHDEAGLDGVGLDGVGLGGVGLGGAGLRGAALEQLRAQAAKRVGLRLRVERVRSWDHRKLARL